MSELIIHTDGGSRGNPGPAAIGVVIEKGSTLITKFGKAIGETTNNVAEYTAVIEALTWLKDHPQDASAIRFVLDSELVVHQMNGVYKIKDARLRDLSVRIHILEQDIGKPVIYTAVRREFNADADAMVNAALDALV